MYTICYTDGRERLSSKTYKKEMDSHLGIIDSTDTRMDVDGYLQV